MTHPKTKPSPAKLQFEAASSLPPATWERLLPARRHETRLSIKRMSGQSSAAQGLPFPSSNWQHWEWQAVSPGGPKLR